MAVKFADSPARSKPTLLCSSNQCVLHHFRSDAAHSLRPCFYRRGTILLEQGQPVWGIYSICRGWIKIARRTVRGKVAGVDLRGPGELLGARELLADEPYSDIYAQAIDDMQAIWIDRTYILDLMSRSPQVLLAISRRSAQISGAVQRRLSHALHAGLEEKIAYLLNCLHQKQMFVQSWGGAALRTSVQNPSTRRGAGSQQL